MKVLDRGAALFAPFLLSGACSTGTASSPVPPPIATDDADVSTEPDGGEVDAGQRPLPSSRFAGLYADVFSVSGAARCQHPSCHGGDDGNAGLSMGADAWDLYRAITSYTYDGKLLVSPKPGGDSRADSAILVVLEPDDPIMPRIDEAVGNRPLTREEWQRIEQWLEVGAPY